MLKHMYSTLIYNRQNPNALINFQSILFINRIIILLDDQQSQLQIYDYKGQKVSFNVWGMGEGRRVS